MEKKLIYIVAVGLIGLLLPACSTTQGTGPSVSTPQSSSLNLTFDQQLSIIWNQWWSGQIGAAEAKRREYALRGRFETFADSDRQYWNNVILLQERYDNRQIDYATLMAGDAEQSRLREQLKVVESEIDDVIRRAEAAAAASRSTGY